MTINERIKQVRLNSGLNQINFAAQIGISSSGMSKLESGENNPSDQTIRLICSEFGINRQWLETGEGERLKLQESASLIPRLQRILNNYPNIAKTVEAALAVMTEDDFQRLTEIIEECKKNSRG